MSDAPSGRLVLEGVAKRFGAIQALDEVALAIEPGEVLAVTGPSGAGKTTLCRLIAGLERPDRGRLTLGGADLAQVPARRRRVAYLFESYALFPHLSVFENAASPLRAPGQLPPLGAGELSERVQQALDLLGIGHLAGRLPAELSGGQKQRVALARALVQEGATATLLDEPISHLDAKLRHRLRGEIKRRLAARPAPAIWSTPDGLEALSVGDRVAVLIDGRIEQLATPQEIWERPASVRVARLIGDPPMSLVEGRVAQGEGPPALVTGEGARLPLQPSLAAGLLQLAGREAVTLGLKPRAIRFLPLGEAGAGSLPQVEIYTVEPFGKHAIVSARIGAALLRAKTAGNCGLAVGQRVGLQLESDGLMVFDGRSGRAIELPSRTAGVA
ncbi:multiple sugar transport system ATP-binding protein [Tistlia consotensis]|uniref:Multiple sugar transport system ATP-binding protein n=1 Tax=Tistlia consotensis USBA 355 TaxID=560819 RepID=A0A1Y6C6W8_9PROT|nr:ABC transporter ATP-binding protein [Tistlia consotensis]SMF37413.1 multiple sugar transport system ATP-binding protein [Tistlia consotensis USBA 355]SNR72768.1 multiple sugar transport system ATP-binding protein [Tistlia consotensis]